MGRGSELQVDLLGPLRVVGSGGRTGAPSGSLQRLLLVRLVLDAGRAVSTDQLMEMLWHTTKPTDAGPALRVHLSRLRSFLAGIIDGGDRLVPLRHAGYMLDIDPASTDVFRFVAAASATTELLSAGQWDAAVSTSSVGLALWRGEPFGDVDDRPFLAAERARLHRLRSMLVVDRAESMLMEDRHHEVLPSLEDAVRSDPLWERLVGLTAIALYRSGSQAEALRVIGATRDALRRNLGVSPGPELSRIELAILHQEPSISVRPRGQSTAQVETSAEHIAPTEPAVIPATLRAEGPRLVGRDELVGQVLAALDDPSLGVTSVIGRAGVGKTRLLAAVAERFDGTGSVLLHGWCSPEGQMAFEPFVHALTPYLHELPQLASLLRTSAAEALVSEDRRAVVFQAVLSSLEELTARAGRLVLILDDMQWADPATVAMIRNLEDRVGTTRMKALVSLRIDEMVDNEPIENLSADLARVGRLKWFPIPVLGPESLVAIARDIVPDPDSIPETAGTRLFDLTGGYPLLCVELLRELGSAVVTSSPLSRVPTTVTALVTRKFRRLDTRASEVLEVASVLGRSFEVEALMSATGLDRDDLAEALDDAISAGVIRERPEHPGEFVFVHDLFVYAIRNRVRPVRRRLIHRRIYEALVGDTKNEPGLVAHHALSAFPDVAAASIVDEVTRAVRHYFAQSAFEIARDLALRSLSVLGPNVGGAGAARLYILLGYACGHLGDFDEARQAFGTAIDLARTTHAHFFLAEAVVARSVFDRQLSSTEPSPMSALSPSETGHGTVRHDTAYIEALAGAVHDLTQRRRSFWTAATSTALVWAQARIDEAASLCHDETPPATRAKVALAQLSTGAAVCTDPHDLIAVARRGLRAADEAREPELCAELATEHAVVLLSLGELRSVRVVLNKLRERSRQHGLRRHYWLCTLMDAGLSLVADDLDIAEAKAMRALSIGTELGLDEATVNHGVQLLIANWVRGDVDDLIDRLAMHAHLNSTVPLAKGAYALALTVTDRDDEAAVMLGRALADLPGLPQNRYWLTELFLVAEVCSRVGSPAQAEVIAELLEPYADRYGVLGTGAVPLGPMLRSAALLDAARGLDEQARYRLEAARDMAIGTGHVLWARRAEHDLVRLGMTAESCEV